MIILYCYRLVYSIYVNHSLTVINARLIKFSIRVCRSQELSWPCNAMAKRFSFPGAGVLHPLSNHGKCSCQLERS